MEELTFPAYLRTLAEEVLSQAGQSWWLATAESCTGGLIAACLTDIAGSSLSFNRGFITYTNEAKAEMLGVNPGLIATHGAVSAEVARAMAEGACEKLGAAGLDRPVMAVAATGVAGPGGGTAKKPVGLVYLSVAAYHRGARPHEVQRDVQRFGEVGRAKVREQAVEAALKLLLKALAA